MYTRIGNAYELSIMCYIMLTAQCVFPVWAPTLAQCVRSEFKRRRENTTLRTRAVTKLQLNVAK